MAHRTRREVRHVRLGYACNPPNARSRVSHDPSISPVRYFMAWYTGEACGFTATLSSAPSRSNHNEVITPAIDALDA